MCLASHLFDCTLFYSRPTQTTHGHWPSGPGQYFRRQCQWSSRHSTKSDQRNLDQEEMEYLLTRDEERSRDREAPIELYLHGLEILGSQQSPEWVCFQKDPAADQGQAPSHQGGVSSGSTMPEDNKTYVACSFTNHWSTKDWKWLFGAAQDMQEYGPWLHHIANQK